MKTREWLLTLLVAGAAQSALAWEAFAENGTRTCR